MFSRIINHLFHMNTISRWSLVPGIVFLVPAALHAAESAQRNGHASKLTLDETWNHKKIELKVGDEIRIELRGTGSTGYQWHFDNLDRDLFQLLSEERSRERNDRGDPVGDPSRHAWVIKARKPGGSVIKLSYYRLWEGKDQVVQRFEVEVEVRP